MNIGFVKSFLAICEHKSISQAAQSLYISQPTLTNQMNKLEEFLNVQIFIRTYKGVELTEYGKLFLPKAIQMINKLTEFQELAESMKDFSNGELHDVSLPSTEAYVIGVNNYFSAAYGDQLICFLSTEFPDMQLDIRIASTEELLANYRYGIMDHLLYYQYKPIHPDAKQLKADEILLMVHEDDYHQVAHSDYHLNEIRKPLYINYNPTYFKYQAFAKQFNPYINVGKIIQTSDIQLIHSLVQCGKGIAALPKSVIANDNKNSSIKTIPLPDEIPNIYLYSLHSQENTKNDKSKEYAKAIEAHIQAL